MDPAVNDTSPLLSCMYTPGSGMLFNFDTA
jgi:hypothetical protein